MSETETTSDVLLELPSDLAYELMEQDVARPYIREDRVGEALEPAMVLAVATALTTVVATKLSDSVSTATARSIRAWLARRKSTDQPMLHLPKSDVAVHIDADVTEAEIAKYLRRANGDESDGE